MPISFSSYARYKVHNSCVILERYLIFVLPQKAVVVNGEFPDFQIRFDLCDETYKYTQSPHSDF
jgi:hypothetical protein